MGIVTYRIETRLGTCTGTGRTQEVASLHAVQLCANNTFVIFIIYGNGDVSVCVYSFKAPCHNEYCL